MSLDAGASATFEMENPLAVSSRDPSLPHSSMATDNPAFAGGDIEAGLKDGTLTRRDM